MFHLAERRLETSAHQDMEDAITCNTRGLPSSVTAFPGMCRPGWIGGWPLATQKAHPCGGYRPSPSMPSGNGLDSD